MTGGCRRLNAAERRVAGLWVALMIAATSATAVACAAPGAEPSEAGASRGAAGASWSVAELAGERVIYSYAGTEPPHQLLSLIRAGEGAGVILSADNVGSVAGLGRAVSTLQHAALTGALHRRLLIMTDQEGGRVRRLPGGPVPSERQIGAAPDPVAAAAVAGRAAAAALARVGANVNLAPVLDVLRRPGDFIDRSARSYSADPMVAAQAGAAFLTAQQAAGIAATAKHFPGLGAASRYQDTDARPVTLANSLEELRSEDERPYRSAIRAGVKLVMLSWASYPHLGGAVPAGLSPVVIRNELRRRLGYRGVTISDAIGAEALRPRTISVRAVEAARAGDDLILCSVDDPSQNSPALGQQVLTALEAAIRRGTLARADAEAAAARVLSLRAGP